MGRSLADLREEDPSNPVIFLLMLKQRLLHHRRFGGPGRDSAGLIAQVEGDIEEWLIEHGHLEEDWDNEE